jgi:hypothetical protein
VRGTNFPNNVIPARRARTAADEVDSSGGCAVGGAAADLRATARLHIAGHGHEPGRQGWLRSTAGGLWPFGNAKRITGPYWPNMTSRGVALTVD